MKRGFFEVVIEDEDAVDDDLAGRIEIKLDELKVGLNKESCRKVRRTQSKDQHSGSSTRSVVERLGRIER